MLKTNQNQIKNTTVIFKVSQAYKKYNSRRILIKYPQKKFKNQ